MDIISDAIYSWFLTLTAAELYHLCILHTSYECTMAIILFMRDSRMLRASKPSSRCPSVCLSHCSILSTRRKLRSRNLHCGLPQWLLFWDP